MIASSGEVGTLNLKSSYTWDRRDIRVALILLAAALIYYLRFFNCGIDLDDEGFLLANAASVLHGGWPIADYYSYPPLSYWILAAAFRSFGELVIVERILLMVLILANVWLVFWAARHVLSLWWALFPAALYAFAPGPWYKVFFVSHFLTVFAATLWMLDRPGWRRAGLLGFAIGLALIGRVEAGVVGAGVAALSTIVGFIASPAYALPNAEGAASPRVRTVMRLAIQALTGAALPVALALGAYALAGKLHPLFQNLDHYYNLVGSADYVNALSGRAARYSFVDAVLRPSRETTAYTFGVLACSAVCLRALPVLWRREPGDSGRLWWGVTGLFALVSMSYTYFYVWNSRMLSSFPVVYIAITLVVCWISAWLRARRQRPLLSHVVALAVLLLVARSVYKFATTVDFYSGSYTTYIKGGMVRVAHPRLTGLWVYEFQVKDIEALMKLTAGASSRDYLVPMSEATTMGYLSGLRNPTYYRLFLSEFAPQGEEDTAIGTFERLKIRFFVARRSQFVDEPGPGSDLKSYAPKIRRYLVDNYEVLPLGYGFVLLRRKQ